MEKALISKREQEVLALYAKGLNYQQIAEELTISPSTVRKHTENIYKKLGAHNKIEAIQKAMKYSLIRL